MTKIRALATAISFLTLLTIAVPPTYASPRAGIPVVTHKYRHSSPAVQQWHDVAMYAGWAEKDWKWLSCIIYRESRGNTFAKYPHGSARGLTQILHRVHKKRVTKIFGSDPAVLYNPFVNLFIAHMLYSESGRAPWGVNKC